MLDEINAGVSAAEKKLRTDFSKKKTKFCLSFHYNKNSTYYHSITEKKSKLFYSILSWSISENFNSVQSEDVSFRGNVYNFSVNYSGIDKSEILKIHKYLIVKNNIK